MAALRCKVRGGVVAPALAGGVDVGGGGEVEEGVVVGTHLACVPERV